MTRKRGVSLVAFLTLAGVTLYFIWNIFLNETPPSPPQTMRDGTTTIALTASRTGRKVEFRHGTFREKLFDFFLPARGLKIAGRFFTRPNQVVKLESRDNRRLFLEFKLAQPVPTNGTFTTRFTTTVGAPAAQGISIRLSGPVVVSGTGSAGLVPLTGSQSTITAPTLSALINAGVLPSGGATITTGAGTFFLSPALSPIYPTGEFRVVLAGTDGFEFVDRFWPQSGQFSDGYVYLQPAMYPRQTRNLSIRIEQREAVLDPWKSVASFTTRISPEAGHWWSPEKSPIRKSRDGLDFVLGEISVHNATFPTEFIGKYEARIPFQVLRDHIAQTNWEAFPLAGGDAGGNDTSIGSFKTISNGWIVLQTLQVLNPNQVWRIRTSFGRVSGFAASNLVSLSLRLPLLQGKPGVFTTNLLSALVQIRAEASDLHFELPANRSDLRLNIVSAQWPDGSENVGDGFRWNERHVGIDFSSHPAAGPLKITLAIHPNYPMEFFVQPVNRIAKQ